MTELEKIEHAKSYIEKLKNGSFDFFLRSF